jgi:pumilio family protein 6
MEMIGDKYNELCYKHDGCRVLQSLVKFGNRPQRAEVCDKLKENYIVLMQQKYSHYLASKVYSFAPEAA